MIAITILKALHVIGFTVWLGGLFLLYRLLVISTRVADKSETSEGIELATYYTWQWEVYHRAVNPGMMVTWGAGLLVLLINPSYLYATVGTPGWMHLKLALLLLLLGFHLFSKILVKRIQSGSSKPRLLTLRFLNGIPVLFLTGIVFLAVLGKAGVLSYINWTIGLILFVAIQLFILLITRNKRTSG